MLLEALIEHYATLTDYSTEEVEQLLEEIRVVRVARNYCLCLRDSCGRAGGSGTMGPGEMNGGNSLRGE